MQTWGQVQHGVRGTQIAMARVPIGESGHGHLPNQSGEVTVVACLDTRVHNLDSVGHPVETNLAGCAQVEVVLKQPA